MRTAGVFEAKARLSELIAAVEAGEEVRITRHGREVVRMLPVAPVEAAAGSKQGEQALATLRRWRAGVKPGPGWRRLRDAGRRY